eukprot:SAG31_NODE_8110_length_1521_cov_2.914205_1_plen_49_part_10
MIEGDRSGSSIAAGGAVPSGSSPGTAGERYSVSSLDLGVRGCRRARRRG